MPSAGPCTRLNCLLQRSIPVHALPAARTGDPHGFEMTLCPPIAPSGRPVWACRPYGSGAEALGDLLPYRRRGGGSGPLRRRRKAAPGRPYHAVEAGCRPSACRTPHRGRPRPSVDRRPLVFRLGCPRSPRGHPRRAGLSPRSASAGAAGALRERWRMTSGSWREQAAGMKNSPTMPRSRWRSTGPPTPMACRPRPPRRTPRCGSRSAEELTASWRVWLADGSGTARLSVEVIRCPEADWRASSQPIAARCVRYGLPHDDEALWADRAPHPGR